MSIPSVLSGRVIEVPNLLPAPDCAALIARAAAQGFATATINQGEHRPDIRSNTRALWRDAALSQRLWPVVAPHVPDIDGARGVGLWDIWRVYGYTPGQFFDWHQDGRVTDAAGRSSLMTLMIYLSDGCTGGGTRFADVFSPYIFADFTIQPKTGKALLFHHDLSHRGEEVTTGVKHVLRTDVIFE
ncbi:MAG: 2OG-Fe(II) oxygenase [Pseudomonadota bacterium]